MKSESPVANKDSKTHMHLFLSCTSCLKNLLRHEFAIAKKHSTHEKRFCIVKLCGKLRCASPALKDKKEKNTRRFVNDVINGIEMRTPKQGRLTSATSRGGNRSTAPSPDRLPAAVPSLSRGIFARDEFLIRFEVGSDGSKHSGNITFGDILVREDERFHL